MKATLLEILENINSESTEHYQMNGLRFRGVSIQKINKIFKQYGVETEIPF